MGVEALAEVLRVGWVVHPASLEGVRDAARSLGWEEGPLRRGEGNVQTLRPVDRSAARPRSMSAHTGTGAQPLHTDGAHMIRPPDVVALSAVGPTSTATRLLHAGQHALPEEAFRQGVFRASSGSRSFLCSAMDGRRFRFDPCCMVPCDQLARKALDFMDDVIPDACRHTWSDSPESLIVDNRQVLHARESVGSSDLGRTIERVAFWIPVAA